MKNYRKSEWNTFREEVIELDGGVCQQCHRSEKDGIVLQVHHKEYLAGKLPWEYPYGLCETLCKGCHAAEHGIIPPKSNWEYCGDVDLGDLTGTCELCGSSLRYEFYVFHAKWPTLSVGTICCDTLTGTETASTLRRKIDRKGKFIKSPRWKEESNGNLNIKQKGVSVVIFQEDSGFRLQLNEITGKLYETETMAMERAFEFIDSGEAEEFFKAKLLSDAENP
jgi:hypothetical protein